MAKDTKLSFVEKIWDFMASVKCAIYLFFLIATTSIVGTIIEQNAAPEKNLQVIGSLFGNEYAPQLYRIFESLGFMDMYRSWWFVVLLLLFASNLFICSIDRFPKIWQTMRKPVQPMNGDQISDIPTHTEVTVQGKPEAVKDKVLTAVKKVGIKVANEKDGSTLMLYGEKGRYSRLGVYLTHFSVLVILMGAIIGIQFGFKGFLNLPEGNVYAMAFGRVGYLTPQEDQERSMIIQALENAQGDVARAASILGVTEERMRNRMKRHRIQPLSFFLRLDDFDVDFYGRSDMAREYSSLLTVIDDGREIVTKRIEVNDPLKYEGFTFYQSSYGLMPESPKYRFIFRTTSRTGVSEEKRVAKGETFTIPGTIVEATVTEFSPALSFDPSGKPFTYAQMMNNPGVRLDIKEGESSYVKWILKRYPETWSLTSGHAIELREVFGAQYTGLQVRRDPGVWIVYLGCTLMSIGLYIAFFMTHQKLWVVLQPSKGATRIRVAGAANKGREVLQRKIDKMISLLREGGK